MFWLGKRGEMMGQTCPGGGNYQIILAEYERNLREAQRKGNKSEIKHWESVIQGLKTEAANRGIKI